MKKYRSIISLWVLFFLVLHMTTITHVNAEENTDYQSFPEIIMTNGKLLRNFTEEEKKNCISNVECFCIYGIKVYFANESVQATYISNTLFSVENSSNTDVTYNVEVEVETSNKVSMKIDGDLSGKFGVPIKKVKADIGAKIGVEVSSTTTYSRKEKKTMKLLVEANSRAIIYLTGQVTVSNGAVAVYTGFIRRAEGCFEIAVMNNQYARIEKTKI